MNCLRCGRQIPDGASFCEECAKTVSQPLEESPYLSSRVILPVRKAGPARPTQPKAAKKAERKAEQAPKRSRGAVAFLSVVVFLLMALVLGVSLLYLNSNRDTVALKQQVSELEEKTARLEREKAFVDERTAYVPFDGSGLYHCSDCVYFDRTSFTVYDINTAKARGLTPCEYCHSAEEMP